MVAARPVVRHGNRRGRRSLAIALAGLILSLIVCGPPLYLYREQDDIVIRVTPEGAGSRVDPRSTSRVGRGDFGANANRVRRFMRQLDTAQAGA